MKTCMHANMYVHKIDMYVCKYVCMYECVRPFAQITKHFSLHTLCPPTTHIHIYLIRTYFSISTSMTHSAKFSTYVPPSLSKVLCIGLVLTIEMLPASPRYCCSQPLPLRWLLAKWNLHNFLYEVNKSSQVQRQFSTCKLLCYRVAVQTASSTV